MDAPLGGGVSASFFKPFKNKNLLIYGRLGGRLFQFKSPSYLKQVRRRKLIQSGQASVIFGLVISLLTFAPHIYIDLFYLMFPEDLPMNKLY